MTGRRGPPTELRRQWLATRIFSVACGITILAGLLILWFGARGLFSTGPYGCSATFCSTPPLVEILTLPVAYTLGICAAFVVIAGAVPRLYLAGIGAGALAVATWWYIGGQLVPVHPPVGGWQYPVGIVAVLLGGALAIIAGGYFGIMSALGEDETPRQNGS